MNACAMIRVCMERQVGELAYPLESQQRPVESAERGEPVAVVIEHGEHRALTLEEIAC